ncbi:PPOX class F420-dependent oxidoreductase [Actinophytocola glycyrrhizae]|uniref:PPOX class F420-dependent oxidoreductase n=1 Tax=Actinophytocola glycyrrhizae TaxID=2044873 RepID=A0ABV9S5K4_9PSEU
MDLDDAREFVRTQHHAVLATTRSDGAPQMSPVVAAVDEAGFVVVSTRETAYKVRNLRRDPKVSLCVLPDNFFGRWLQLDGVADIVSLPDAMTALEDYYRRISGEHPDWDEYRSMMRTEQRVLLRIRLLRAGPDNSG